MYPAVFYTYDGHFLIGKKKKDQDSGVLFFFCLFVFIVVCCFIFVWLVSLLVWFVFFLVSLLRKLAAFTEAVRSVEKSSRLVTRAGW